MNDMSLIPLVINMLLMNFVFWLFTVITTFFYSKKNNFMKKEIYECGFRSNNVKVDISLSFSILCVLLILYDTEFLFIFPILFNVMVSDFLSVIFIFLYLLLIVISFYFDWMKKILSWQN